MRTYSKQVTQPDNWSRKQHLLSPLVITDDASKIWILCDEEEKTRARSAMQHAFSDTARTRRVNINWKGIWNRNVYDLLVAIWERGIEVNIFFQIHPDPLTHKQCREPPSLCDRSNLIKQMVELNRPVTLWVEWRKDFASVLSRKNASCQLEMHSDWVAQNSPSEEVSSAKNLAA